MSYKKTMQGVKYLVQNELDMACEEHGNRFNSDHEAYAVIHEEIEEMLDEVEKVELFDRSLWHIVMGDLQTDSSLRLIEDAAIRCACEAIQVAAMARKAMR